MGHAWVPGGGWSPPLRVCLAGVSMSFEGEPESMMDEFDTEMVALGGERVIIDIGQADGDEFGVIVPRNQGS